MEFLENKIGCDSKSWLALFFMAYFMSEKMKKRALRKWNFSKKLSQISKDNWLFLPIVLHKTYLIWLLGGIDKFLLVVSFKHANHFY